jgi:hypothetical protein
MLLYTRDPYIRSLIPWINKHKSLKHKCIKVMQYINQSTYFTIYCKVDYFTTTLRKVVWAPLTRPIALTCPCGNQLPARFDPRIPSWWLRSKACVLCINMQIHMKQASRRTGGASKQVFIL